MPKKIVIIGGGTAGASAAFSARKTDRKAEITVLDKESYPTYSRCGLPFVIKGIIPAFENLIVFDEKFYSTQKINHKLNSTVTNINPRTKQILFSQNNREERLNYDVLIIATGAYPVKPPIEGLEVANVFTLRTINDAKTILTAAEKSKSVVIIGASFIGLELAEALKEKGLEVTLVEAGRIMWRAVDEDISRIISQYLSSKGIKVIEGEVVQKIIPTSRHKGVGIETLCVETKNTKSGTTNQIQTNPVILSTGTKPEVTLAKKTGIEIGKMGGITVNDKLETNLKDVYAAGDCVEVISPITAEPVVVGSGTIATRQGLIAGANASGANEKAPPAFNTSVCKIFDLEIGSIGFTESHLKEHYADKPASPKAFGGFMPISVMVKYPSLPHYYPGGTDIYIKLIANARSQRLVGAQIVGQTPVAQRINTLALAFEKKCSVNELIQTDFCYSPPVADIWDPITIAAQSLARKLTSLPNF